MDNPAVRYNRARHNVFSIFHKYGKINTDWFSSIAEENALPQNACTGLYAEIQFYARYKNELKLVVGLDCGDKADFAGEIDGRISKIDVTTNIGYKNLLPVIVSDVPHYIILINPQSGEIIQRYPLSLLNRCDEDVMSTEIQVLILKGPEYDKDGCSKYNPYQEILTIDISDFSIKDRKVVTEWYIEDYPTHISNLPEEIDDDAYSRAVENYGADIARFFDKEYGTNILGCLSYEYKLLTPDGDGEYGLYLRWCHQLLKGLGYNVGDELPLDDY